MTPRDQASQAKKRLLAKETVAGSKTVKRREKAPQPAVAGMEQAARCQTPLEAVLASRKPVVAAQIKEPRSDGTVAVEILADEDTDKRREVLARLRKTVEHLFQSAAKAEKLKKDEWAQLLTRETPASDLRWQLLLRIAAEVPDETSGLRELFVALPDGTPFSMRLLLLDRRSGPRGTSVASDAEDGTIAFASIPDVVRLAALQRALERERMEGKARTDARFASLFEEELCPCDLPVKPLTGNDMSGFREKLQRNGGKDLFPNFIERRHQLKNGGDPSR